MKPLQRMPNFTTDRPVAVLMVFLAAVVFGYFSLGRLPVMLMPEMNYPTLTVRTEYPGAAPEEVENDISRPIEEQLGVVSGLNEISSISRAGVSDVVLEFVSGEPRWQMPSRIRSRSSTWSICPGKPRNRCFCTMTPRWIP